MFKYFFEAKDRTDEFVTGTACVAFQVKNAVLGLCRIKGNYRETAHGSTVAGPIFRVNTTAPILR